MFVQIEKIFEPLIPNFYNKIKQKPSIREKSKLLLKEKENLQDLPLKN